MESTPEEDAREADHGPVVVSEAIAAGDVTVLALLATAVAAVIFWRKRVKRQ